MSEIGPASACRFNQILSMRYQPWTFAADHVLPEFFEKSQYTRRRLNFKNTCGNLASRLHVAMSGASFNFLKMKCRGRLSSIYRRGLPLGWERSAITTPSVSRLTHAYSASYFLCLFGFAQFSCLNAVTLYLATLLDVALLIH